jgi:hypothetical protein
VNEFFGWLANGNGQNPAVMGARGPGRVAVGNLAS